MHWPLFVIAAMSMFAAVSIWAYLKGLKRHWLHLGRFSLLFTSLLSMAHLLVELQKDLAEQRPLLLSNLSFVCAISFICWLLSWRKHLLNLSMFASFAMAFLFTGLGVWGHLFPGAGMPSAWVWAHVSLLLVGEIFLFLAAMTGVAYLWGSYKLHTKKQSPFLAGTPSLAELDLRKAALLKWGFAFLTIGMLFGFLFAQRFWSGEWWSDWKIILALVTWITYALLLSLRHFSQKFRGRASAIGSILGFILVILVVVGIDRWSEIERWRKVPTQSEELR